MNKNGLPDSEIKLAIYLEEMKNKNSNKCDLCVSFTKCKKQFVGGKGMLCQWYPTRFERV